MKIQDIHKKIPTIVKRISVASFTIGTTILGYGALVEEPLFTKIGGVCMIISAGLPPLFGLKSPKDETSN